MRGRPSIVEKVKEDLWRIIRQARLSNDPVLPGERELASLLSVSRCTLRKVLDDLESSQVITRANQMTRLLPERKLKGRYAFLAAGNRSGDRFLFALYQRLWEEFSLQRGKLDIDLIFVPHIEPSPQKSLISRLRQYDVIFVSYIQQSLFHSLVEAGLPLVALDEQNSAENCPLISLDNRMVGRRAAELLLQAGCRRALTIEYVSGGDYEPFRYRQEGFQQAFEGGGGQVASICNPPELVNPLECMNALASLMAEHLHDGTDAVFFLSNECLSILGWYWYDAHRIPDEVKLITFQGTSEPRGQFADIDYLTMDCVSVAAAMMSVVRHFSDKGTLPPPIHQFIPPVYCEGETIRKKRTTFTVSGENAKLRVPAQ